MNEPTLRDAVAEHLPPTAVSRLQRPVYRSSQGPQSDGSYWIKIEVEADTRGEALVFLKHQVDVMQDHP